MMRFSMIVKKFDFLNYYKILESKKKIKFSSLFHCLELFVSQVFAKKKRLEIFSKKVELLRMNEQ